VKEKDKLGTETDARGITRREFLQGAAGAAVTAGLVGLGTGFDIEEVLAAAKTPKSRVVVVTHKKVLVEGWQADPKVMQAMIDEGMKRLTGEKTALAAWKKIVKPDDLVSMKPNPVGGVNLKTHQEVSDACVNGARLAGAKEDRVIVWNKSQGVPEAYKGWSDAYEFPNGKKTRIGNILDKHTTCFINLPVVKAHWGKGYTCTLKNHFGTNDNPSELHDWESATAPMWENVAYLNNIPAIKRCTKLVIADATRPLYSDGPGDKPAYRWDYYALILGKDPVAVDRIGLDILDDKRKAEGMSPLTWGRQSLEKAAEIGVGNYDLSKIDLLRVNLG